VYYYPDKSMRFARILSLFFLCAFASLADVAKEGDGAQSALREIFVFGCGYAALCSFGYPFRSYAHASPETLASSVFDGGSV
jgi:hypothetical protein